MNGYASLASWILMSLGTSGMLLFVCLNRFRRALPPDGKAGRFFGVSGEPELGIRIATSFLLGLGGVIVTGFILLLFRNTNLLRNPVLGPFFEESMKLALLALFITPHLSRGLNRVSAVRLRTFAIGFMGINGMALGIGFGLGEAILYALDEPRLLLLRGVSSIVLHALTGAIASRYLATRAVSIGCWKCPLVATGLHLLYNFLVLQTFPLNYLVFFVLLFFAMQILRMFSFQEEY